MIQLVDDDFFISATSIEATFSDGSRLSNETANITIRTKTALGDEIWIQGASQEEDGPSAHSHIIRLIAIPAERDWRVSASYAWKLDSAWMSVPSRRGESDFEWLHWNVESYTDSVIQVDNPNSIWECDKLEIHFRPIRAGHQPASDGPVTQNEHVVLTGVQLALHLTSPIDDSTTHVSPCAASSESAPCAVVDGKVVGAARNKTYVSYFANNPQSLQLLKAGTCLTILLGFLVIGTCCLRRYHQRRLYERLRPNQDDDLTLTVEDDSNQVTQGTLS